MTLTVELTPEEEARLQERARQEGLPTEEYVRRRLLADLNGAGFSEQKPTRSRTEELLAQWEAEDAKLTPEELAAEEADWKEFQANINAYRAEQGEEPVY